MRRISPVSMVALFCAACGASPLPQTTEPGAASPAAIAPWAETQGATFVSTQENFVAPTGSFVEEMDLGDGCHIFVVTAASGIRDADLAIWTADGERLIADEAPDARPVVQICGARRVFVRVSAPSGAGVVSLHRFAATEAVSLEGFGEGAATYEEAELSEREAALYARGFRRERLWTLDAPGDSIDLALGENVGCFTLVVRGGGAEVVVRSSESDEEVRARGNPAMLQWCMSRRREQRATIRAAEETTHFRVELLRATQGRVVGESDLWLGDRSRSALE